MDRDANGKKHNKDYVFDTLIVTGILLVLWVLLQNACGI